MSGYNSFWLAQYAHHHLSPLMEPLDAYLKIDLHFESSIFAGVDVWIHGKSGQGVVTYGTAIPAQREMNKFIVHVQSLTKASIAA
jgi:hypothetical protein